jgi:hypothetical protein
MDTDIYTKINQLVSAGTDKEQLCIF